MVNGSNLYKSRGVKVEYYKIKHLKSIMNNNLINNFIGIHKGQNTLISAGKLSRYLDHFGDS